MMDKMFVKFDLKSPSFAEVSSRSSDTVYLVNWRQGSCTCRWYTIKGTKCAHVRGVEEILSLENLNS